MIFYMGMKYVGCRDQYCTIGQQLYKLPNTMAFWIASRGLGVSTHWDRVTYICVSKLTIIASDNGLSPGRRQAIIWTNSGKLLIGNSGTNFSENEIEIDTISFRKMTAILSRPRYVNVTVGTLKYEQTRPINTTNTNCVQKCISMA